MSREGTGSGAADYASAVPAPSLVRRVMAAAGAVVVLCALGARAEPTSYSEYERDTPGVVSVVLDDDRVYESYAAVG